jgi:hypothetical protein
MRLARTGTVVVSLFIAIQALAQQTTSSSPPPVQRDAQATALLKQVVSAAGGAAALAAIQGFTANGNVTYYWANKEVQGPASILSLGLGQFRIDAQLPNGTRTWLVTNGTGSIRESDGSVSQIPSQNAVNLGSLTLPYPLIVAALNDTSMAIEYLGTSVKNGRNAYQIRIHPIGLDADPSGALYKAAAKDFFIDATSFQVISTLDMVRPDLSYDQKCPHEITFLNYSTASSILVPFSVREQVAGQQTWTVQLTNIDFTAVPSDQDFQL